MIVAGCILIGVMVTMAIVAIAGSYYHTIGKKRCDETTEQYYRRIGIL